MVVVEIKGGNVEMQVEESGFGEAHTCKKLQDSFERQSEKSLPAFVSHDAQSAKSLKPILGRRRRSLK